MRANILLVIISCITSSICLSQSRRVTIIDSTDKSILPYATIKALNANSGYYSDTNGNAFIRDGADSLLIEYSGYSSKIVRISSMADTILLIRKPNILPDVVVTYFRHKKQFGDFKYNRSYSLCFPHSIEHAQKIEMTGNDGFYKIEKIYLPARHNEYATEDIIVKVHLYKQDENGFPAEDILDKPIILNKDYFIQKKFFIDISDQNIISAEKNLFVGLELISSKPPPIEKPSSYKPPYCSILLYSTKAASSANNRQNSLYTRSFYGKMEWQLMTHSRFPGFAAGIIAFAN